MLAMPTAALLQQAVPVHVVMPTVPVQPVPVVMTGPGVFHVYLGRTPSLIKMKELPAGELHVMLHTTDTLSDYNSWFIYKRPEDGTETGPHGFGSETDPEGCTWWLQGDGRSPSIREDRGRGEYSHLPNLVLLWLWVGLPLAQLTMRYVRRHDRSQQATMLTVANGLAQFGGSVRVAVELPCFIFVGAEDGEDLGELVFDNRLKHWCLPRTFTPLPRHIVQWLASEAVRLGMVVLDTRRAF